MNDFHVKALNNIIKVKLILQTMMTMIKVNAYFFLSKGKSWLNRSSNKITS